MTFLRSLLFNIVFFGSGALVLTAALPVLLMRRPAVMVFGGFWCRLVTGALRVICGVSHEVRGRENLPAGPCIIAAKHQSTWDTMVLVDLVADASYVIKRELLRIPVYGWLLAKAGMIPIDRAGGAKALRGMIKLARAHLAAGRSIVIFPEGTRTAPGERRPYHPGIAALYTQLRVPVVPLALNSGLCWPRRAFIKRPGHIVIQILPPVPPGLKRDAFMARLEEEIESASARLSRTGPDCG